MLAVASARLAAETPSPVAARLPQPPPQPSAGLANGSLEQTPFFDPFNLGGQFRARFVDQTYFAVPAPGQLQLISARTPPRAQTIFSCCALGSTSAIPPWTG